MPSSQKDTKKENKKQQGAAMSLTLRSEVLQFTPYTPGLSIEEIQERHGLTQVIKLASNENPLGVSPVVQKRIQDKANMVFRYPQAGNPRLVRALAEHLGVTPDRIVVGNGSDELIDLLIRVRVRTSDCPVHPAGEEVLASIPCFSMYELQARLCGVGFRQVPLLNDFRPDLKGLLAAVNEHTGIVFITSPDNPSGLAITADELADFAGRLPQNCLLVVDEAYIDFALPMEKYCLLPRLAAEPEKYQNVVLLRTFSKMFGLAGLRLGYGIFPAWLADYMWRVRMPFSVNILAEEAGLAALEDKLFYQASLEAVTNGREVLTKGFTELGCKVWPSQANFLLLAPPSGVDAIALFEGMLAKGVIIRPLKSYGMPELLRVSIGSEKENQTCLEVMRNVLQADGGV